MLKKVNRILNLVIFAILGLFVGFSLYEYVYYRTHAELVASWSAPWYSGILIWGIMAGSTVITLLLAKWFIKRNMGD